MVPYISVILIVTAIFLALILRIALKPGFSAKLTRACLLIAAVGGIILYGYGYAYLESNILVAIIRAVIAVCRSFAGTMDYSVITGTPLNPYSWVHVLFWVLQLVALYITASAAVGWIGGEALKKLRLWMARRGNLSIIYGVNSDSVAFGRAIMAQTKEAVLFVDPKPDPACVNAVSQNGCLLRSDDHAVKADKKFAKEIGIRPGKRKVNLYAMNYDGFSNLRYADQLLDTLKELEIEAENTSLYILGVPDESASQLQVTDGKYGYGFVTVFQETDLVSRLLIQKYPPCDTMEFDENGVATENFEAMIVGFGELGQSVLRSLVMNGQFVGSNFRCTVFDPQCNHRKGILCGTCKTLMSSYDISLQPYDARSEEMFTFLEEHGAKLKYIAVCTNNVQRNQKIAADILQLLSLINPDLPVYQCSQRGILKTSCGAMLPEESTIYTPSLLRYEQVDRLAMGINQTYLVGTDKTPLQNWMACDYFSRMSSRASADFFPAILRAAHTTAQEVAENNWQPEGQLLENLGKMEHLRWNAFHFCMGYNPMTDEEFNRRCEGYREDIRQQKKPRRIGKNTVGRTHACLVSWDELDALSAKENAVTGGNVDYKAMDIRNVLAIGDILRASE